MANIIFINCIRILEWPDDISGTKGLESIDKCGFEIRELAANFLH